MKKVPEAERMNVVEAAHGSSETRLEWGEDGGLLVLTQDKRTAAVGCPQGRQPRAGELCRGRGSRRQPTRSRGAGRTRARAGVSVPGRAHRPGAAQLLWSPTPSRQRQTADLVEKVSRWETQWNNSFPSFRAESGTASDPTSQENRTSVRGGGACVRLAASASCHTDQLLRVESTLLEL